MTAAVGAVLTLIRGGLDAFGSLYGGFLQKGVYKAYAGVSEAQAQVERASAGIKEYKARKDLRSMVSAQQAGYAKAGVSTMTGSPIDVMFDTVSTAELDISINNINSGLQARGYEIQGLYQKRASKNAPIAGIAQAGRTLLQTGTQAYLTFGTKTKIGQ